jgi:hypothetical protein
MIGDPTLKRTWLYGGANLRTLAEMSGVGRGEEMFLVAGEQGSGGFIPPLHASLARYAVEAKAPRLTVDG